MSEVIDFDTSVAGAVVSNEIRSAFQENIVVLLGAGASIEAGIPGSFGMTEEIVKSITTTRYHSDNQAWALNFVCGALQAHATALGGNYYDTLDVEYVASAVSLLANRHAHEAAPFVQQWNPAIQQIEVPTLARNINTQTENALSAGAETIHRAINAQSPSGRRVDIKSAMKRGSRDLIQAVSSLIDARSGRRSSQIYEALLTTMTGLLCEKVAIDDPSTVAYLKPLAEKARSQGSLVVGTLNYDRSVEILCTSNSLPCSTGIESWSHDRTISPVSEGIELLKLHGSVDWVDRASGYTAAGRLPSTQISVQSWSSGMQGKPVIVFGRDKLRAGGPFLDLLHEWETRIRESNVLLIIGYSFRDDHINETVSRWINEGDDRHLYVVDPGWPPYFGRTDDFRNVLFRYLRGMQQGNSFGTTRRLHVLKTKTSSALNHLW